VPSVAVRQKPSMEVQRPTYLEAFRRWVASLVVRPWVAVCRWAHRRCRRTRDLEQEKQAMKGTEIMNSRITRQTGRSGLAEC
jgi:hypothetical protein